MKNTVIYHPDVPSPQKQPKTTERDKTQKPLNHIYIYRNKEQHKKKTTIYGVYTLPRIMCLWLCFFVFDFGCVHNHKLLLYYVVFFPCIWFCMFLVGSFSLRMSLLFCYTLKVCLFCFYSFSLSCVFCLINVFTRGISSLFIASCDSL